jgi:hypothetical protein
MSKVSVSQGDAALVCYNSGFQQLTFGLHTLSCKGLKRVAAGLAAAVCAVAMVSCGGSGNSSVTTPNGNTINVPSKLKNRAFITNQYSGNVQIVDSADDKTAYYSSNQTNTNTTNQIVDLAVRISVGISLTFEVVSPNKATTAVYDPTALVIGLVNNSTEADTANVALPAWAAMAVFSPDSNTIYVPTGNAPVAGSSPGAIQVLSVTNTNIASTISVPSVRWVALNPAGTILLAFADNSDNMWLINLGATTITPVAIPGFSRPVNAFFSSDGNTAYVLNCGNQCGGTAAPSVVQFDMTSQTIKATVVVGGATVGLLNGTTLYVAGYAGGANGTLDAVDLSSMTRTTANSIVINDGQQWIMALNNNMLYVGAKTCSNAVTGCLSIVNVSTNTAVAPGPPLGPVTGLLSVPNRNVMYVIQGGVLSIYDTTNNTPLPSIGFRGALYGVAQVDQ